MEIPVPEHIEQGIREHGRTLVGQEQGRGFLIRRTKEDRPFPGETAASGPDSKGIQGFRNGSLIWSPEKCAKSSSGKATVQEQIPPRLASLFSQHVRQRVNGHARCSQDTDIGATRQEVKIRRRT